MPDDNKVVYVVEGNTGEYSDHQTWPVCAFMEEEDAKQCVLSLTRKLRELGLARGGDIPLWLEERERLIDAMKQHDKEFSLDYTGSDYTYWGVELREGGDAQE